MATPRSPLPLPGAAFCPLCREFFRDPVSIHCGHHFCRCCIERRWEWSTAGFSCPRCRQKSSRRSIRPSRELEKVLEIARRLSRGENLGMEEEEEEEGCGKHGEPLEVFCREDGAALCAICSESRAHRGHGVLPLPEALREFRGQIESQLQTLKEDKDKLLQFREAEMRRNWEILVKALERENKTQTERQKILSQFQTLQLSLESHSCHLLALLGDLQRDIGKLQEDNVTSLTQEISRLEIRVEELQEKLRQPDGTFLQDISSTLSSLGKENFQLPSSPPPELEEKIRRFRERNVLLEEILRSFQDILMFELPEKMTVTLDPSTAHPQLRVAPDGGSVTWERGRDTPGDKLGHEWDTGTGQEPLGDRLGHELDTGTSWDTPGDRFGHEWDIRTGQDTPGDKLGPEWDTGTGQKPLGDRVGPQISTGDRFGPELDTGTGQDTPRDKLGQELDTGTDRDLPGDRFGPELDTRTGQDILGDRLGHEWDIRTGQEPLGDRLGHELDTGTGQDILGDRFGREWDIRTGQDLLGDKFGPANGTGDRFGPETGPDPLGDRFGPKLDTRTGQDTPGDKSGPANGTGDRFGPEISTGDKSRPANGTGDRFGPETGPGTRADPPDSGPITDPAVLGHQGVTSGCHCWDVQVSPAGSWAVGVARVTLEGDTVTPEGDMATLEGDMVTPEGDTVTLEGDTATLEGDTATPEGDTVTLEGDTVTLEGDMVTPEGDTVTLEGDRVTLEGDTMTLEGDTATPEGDMVTLEGDTATPGWELWSFGQCQGQFWALTSLERIPLSPIDVPKVVRVALDYERGQVAFFDGDKRRLIFAFPAVCFEGKRVHPWFLVWGEGARLALRP